MRTKIFFLFVLISALPSMGHAVATWTRVNNGVYPWTIATDLVQFNSVAYVSASGAKDASATRLWKSTDWQTWEPVFIHQNLRDIDRMTVANGTLYVFGHTFDTVFLTTPASIYRSLDGESWEAIDAGPMNTSKRWGDVEPFGGHVYVSSSTNSPFYRFSTTDPAAPWGNISIPLNTPALYEFTVFNSMLFAARIPVGATAAQMGTTYDGDSWNNLVPVFRPADVSDEITKHNFTVYNGALLFSFGQMFRYDEDKEEWGIAGDVDFKRNFLIFSIFDQLMTKLGENSSSFHGAIFRRTASAWEKMIKVIGDTPNEPSVIQTTQASLNFNLNGVPRIETGGKALVMLGDLWRADGGVTSVQKEAFVIDPLEAAQKNKTVFAWSVTSDFSEAMKNLVVENKGSAESVTDISKVTLYRGSTSIVNLLPVVGQTKFWATPINWSETRARDGFNDVFYLKIDINKSVREGKSVQFSIPANGIEWGENTAYVMPGELDSMVAMSIKSLGVTGVTLMPFPSANISAGDKDVLALKFHVTLDSTDTLKAITVTNKETAEASLDISKVKLRIINNVSITTIELSPTSDNKSWASSVSWPGYFMSTSSTIGDQFEIIVDISPTARLDRKIQFSLPQTAFRWEVNNDFLLLSDLTEDDILSHPTVAPGPIPEVIAFPNPARDTVRFSYDLTADADVTVSLFDLTGNLISEVRETKTAGTGVQTAWDASGKAPGTYFAVIKIISSSGEKRIYKRKVFIKK